MAHNSNSNNNNNQLPNSATLNATKSAN